jgi:uncharacterized protein YjhX (UPF0386 family)
LQHHEAAKTGQRVEHLFPEGCSYEMARDEQGTTITAEMTNFAIV